MKDFIGNRLLVVVSCGCGRNLDLDVADVSTSFIRSITVLVCVLLLLLRSCIAPQTTQGQAFCWIAGEMRGSVGIFSVTTVRCGLNFPCPAFQDGTDEFLAHFATCLTLFAGRNEHVAILFGQGWLR